MPMRSLLRFRGSLLWLVLLLWESGCYRWNVVPTGVQQQLVDLPVDGMTQRYTTLRPLANNVPTVEVKSPAVIVLHSGFSGDEATSADLARNFAKRGIVAILPSYRGEVRKADGKRSDGKVEFCKGEVADAEAALTWLRQQPNIDAGRIGVLGLSHGGCIALRLASRVMDLRALATMSAPVAAGPFVQHLEDKPYQTFFFNGILASQIKSYVQATPAQQPQAYEERSPIREAGKLSVPMLVIHGTDDQIVPMEQACMLLQSLRENNRVVREYRMDRDGKVSLAVNSACGDIRVQPSPFESRVRTDFIFMEGQGHIYSSRAKASAEGKAVEFLVQELTH
jgi:dienelactone hydrolase